MPDAMTLQYAQLEWTVAMLKAGKDAVKKHTPRATGDMARHLASHSIAMRTASGYTANMGYLNPLRINRGAPRSTIKRFLQWYRHARATRKSVASSRPFPIAWYVLKPDEKNALFAARTGSNFGGPHPPPTYTEAVNAGKVPLPAGSAAYAKAQANKGFIERVQNEMVSNRNAGLVEVLKVVRP